MEALAALDNEAFALAYELILRRARQEGLNGFGGFCAQAAYAIPINAVIFGGAAGYVGAFNTPLLEREHPIGHIVLDARDAYWDADGIPKGADDIDHWGILDRDDQDHQSLAAAFGLELDAIADDADLYAFEAGEFDPMIFARDDRRAEFVMILENACATVLTQRGGSFEKVIVK